MRVACVGPDGVKFTVKLKSWLPLLTGHDCVTVRSTVYCRKSSLHRRTVAHEWKHTEQWRRYGVLGFAARYLWLLLTHGYTAHPFEVEAHQYAAAHETEFASVYDKSVMSR